MAKLATTSLILSLTFLVQSLLTLTVAHADRLDADTDSLVISKLETALPGLKGQPSEAGVLLRVADLYAERARLKAIDEENLKCESGKTNVQCEGSKKDRAQAIAYYLGAYGRLEGDTKTHALMQITHLYTIDGDTLKAENFFKATLDDKSTTRDVRGECLAGLGELYFRTGRFTESQAKFEESLKYEIANPTFVNYRLSWCYFNAGQSAKSKAILVDALKSKKSIDPAFQKDMARDLATFIARDGISNASIDELMALSPEAEKRPNLFYLGQEADRLGNKSGSLLVWRHYQAMGAVAGDESLEIQIRTAQTLSDQGYNRSALELYKKFYLNLAKADCKNGENCDELHARSRVFVHNWIKREKRKPSEYLFEALKTFVQNNPHDVEMVEWSGHLARRLKQTALAAQYYATAADESVAQLRASDLTAIKKQFLTTTLEGSLLAEMECAEDSADKITMAKAYQHYISLRPDGARHFQVQYQMAHLKYDAKQFAAAADEFDRVAVDPKCADTALKIKAADLALDSWANLGNAAQVEARSKVYASNFPSRRNSYFAVSRKATVNAAITRFSQKSNDNAQVGAALAEINAAPLTGASDSELAGIYKNQILMAQKINDLTTVDSASKKMLALRKISTSERDFAWSAQLWVAEARLDFDRAFTAAQHVRSSESVDAMYLKLALLADLSGRNSRPYYDKFLRTTHNLSQASSVYAKLIEESRQPWRTLKSYREVLRRTPEVFGASVIEAYAKASDPNEMRKYLVERSVRRSSSYTTISRFVQLSDDRYLDRALIHSRLSHKSDGYLQKTFSARLALLKTANLRANAAMAHNDFTLEIVDLNRVAVQYSRLANEFLQLPIPRTLKRRKDRIEYARLIHLKVAPFQRVADSARQKIAALWLQSGAMVKFMELSQIETGGARKLLISDLHLLQKFAPQDQQRAIAQALTQAGHTPTNAEIAQARSAVRAQPFDTEKIEALKKLEVRRDATSMVVFLEARLESLNAKAVTR